MLEDRSARVDLKQGMANPCVARLLEDAGDSVAPVPISGAADALFKRLSQHPAIAFVPVNPSHVRWNADSDVANGKHRTAIAAAVSLSGQIAAQIVSPMLH
jgi:hypothetical protein